jgi:ketosteroid isomerase-like protein
MNLPEVVADLVKAQNNFDSAAYANCFTETAVVFDEGKTHKGRKEIEQWIAEANEKYNAIMKPVEFSEGTQTLRAEISGAFDGSPIVLTYLFELKGDEIQSLKII